MARGGIVLTLFALLRVTVCLNVSTVFSFAEYKNGLDLLSGETEIPSLLIDDGSYVSNTKTATITVSSINYDTEESEIETKEEDEDDENDDDSDEEASGGDRLERIEARNSSDFDCRRITNNLSIEFRFVMALTLIFTSMGFVVLCGAIYFLARPALRSRREYDLRRATYVRLSDIGKAFT